MQPQFLRLIDYDEVIRIAAEDGDPARAEWWLKEMVSSGDEPGKATYHALLESCALAGDAVRALRVLELMSVPDDHCHLSVAVAYARAGDVSAAIAHYYKAARGVVPRRRRGAARELLAACAEAGDVYGADHWLEELLSTAPRLDTHSRNYTLAACAAVGDADQAIQLLHDMQGERLTPNTSSYASVARAIVSTNQSEVRDRWLESLQKTSRLTAGVFTGLAKAYADYADVHQAEGALRELQRHSLEPDAAMFSALARAEAEACRPQGALPWFDHMRHKRLQPDAECCSALLRCHLQDSGVLNVFDTIKKVRVQPDAKDYQTVIHALLKRGKIVGARRLIEEMRVRRIQPSEDLFNALAGAHSHVTGYLPYPGAEAAVHMMVLSGLAPGCEIYTSVVEACAVERYRDIMRAEMWMTRMRKASTPPDVSAYSTLVAGYEQLADAQAALKVLERMREEGVPEDASMQASAKRLVLRLEADGAALDDDNARAQEGEGAAETDKASVEEGAPHKAVRVRGEDVEEATPRLRSRTREGKERLAEEAPKPDRCTLAAAVCKHAAAGELTEAERHFLDSAAKKNYDPGAKALAALLSAHAEVGDVARVTLWLHRMAYASALLPKDWLPVVIAGARTGNAAAAVQSVATAIDCTGAWVCRHFVRHLFAAGEFDAVVQLGRSKWGGWDDHHYARFFILSCATMVPPAIDKAVEVLKYSPQLKRDRQLIYRLSSTLQRHQFEYVSTQADLETITTNVMQPALVSSVFSIDGAPASPLLRRRLSAEDRPRAAGTLDIAARTPASTNRAPGAVKLRVKAVPAGQRRPPIAAAHPSPTQRRTSSLFMAPRRHPMLRLARNLASRVGTLPRPTR
eukprot:NODE_663_length_2855_cov_9.287757.p1 GENE.NODE_663_length_2855_cov_9.287757~~NODE_663_length_2855_cov_9.287757.p1  ORF type:complete len:872 (-),score=202.02 NODE_663_length_2855_cov_9.287757:238-2817(-)